MDYQCVKQFINMPKKPLDVHLMIEKPENYIQAFHDAGAATISVHYEASPHLHRTLQAIRDLGLRAGVAINPHTNVSLLENVIQDTDLVCMMSVNPGFGGQKFIEQTYAKVRQLKELIADQNASTLIEIDGGVNIDNAPKLLEAGADVLVAGNFVFKSENPIHTIQELKKRFFLINSQQYMRPFLFLVLVFFIPFFSLGTDPYFKRESSRC